MTNKEIVERLNAVISTLNNVNVSGIENMQRILGCVSTLGEVSAAVQKTDGGTVMNAELS